MGITSRLHFLTVKDKIIIIKSHPDSSTYLILFQRWDVLQVYVITTRLASGAVLAMPLRSRRPDMVMTSKERSPAAHECPLT